MQASPSWLDALRRGDRGRHPPRSRTAPPLLRRRSGRLFGSKSKESAPRISGSYGRWFGRGGRAGGTDSGRAPTPILPGFAFARHPDDWRQGWNTCTILVTLRRNVVAVCYDCRKAGMGGVDKGGTTDERYPLAHD